MSGAERWSQSLGLDPSAVAFQLLWVSGTYATVHNRGKLTVTQQQGNHLVGEHSPGRCVTAGRVRKVGNPRASRTGATGSQGAEAGLGDEQLAFRVLSRKARRRFPRPRRSLSGAQRALGATRCWAPCPAPRAESAGARCSPRGRGPNCARVLRFLDHIKNEDSPGPPIGSHHAFFSDDQEPYPVTDIADLIRDSYEVPEPLSRPPGPFLLGGRSVPGTQMWRAGFWLALRSAGPVSAEIREAVCGADRAPALQAQNPGPAGPRGHHQAERGEQSTPPRAPGTSRL